MEVACLAVPDLALLAACESRSERLEEALALAPQPGAGQRVGEVSAAAASEGVRVGMRLAEALARCPELKLVPPDPGAAADLSEAMVRGLEGIGAAVESERLGEAFFATDGLKGIHGGDAAGVIAAARRAVEMPVRAAVAPTRFAAFVAASQGRPLCAELSIAILAPRLGASGGEAQSLILTLGRLGIRTLGALARLSPEEMADRFGPLGLRALCLARGEDTPLRPRGAQEELAEEIELPDGTSGSQLDRALELLIDRLLAAPRRRGRTLLALRLGARLGGGGSWSVAQGLGRPTASAQVLRSLLTPRLALLPGPAVSLRLRAVSLGPPVGDQLELSTRDGGPRRGRLAAAVREVRALDGVEALLKVLPVDADSHIPERRAMLTPFPEA